MNVDDENEQKKKLIELLQAVVQNDKELREKYQMGDRFRFIRERLQTLFENVEKNVKLHVVTSSSTATVTPVEDEVAVYVYLYNAKGNVLKNWQSMISEKFFYEYGFNRPIYAEKKYVEAILRSKHNKLQHAFLTFLVKTDRIISSSTMVKDALDNPQIKLKEGALRLERLVSLTYHDHEYKLNSEGVLVKC